jgi:diphthine-ammonia ligase
MRTAILWTGGKDSVLAYHRSARADVTDLVTFVPPAAQFQAHDLELMGAQARSLGVPHRRIIVDEPYERGYESALRELREEGIERVVTGDIAEVDGHPNFIAACARGSGIQAEFPLWGVDRQAYLAEIVSLGFEVIFTLVNEPWFDASWVGRRLDAQSLDELAAMHRTCGLDVTGENGEYHSMVLGGPGFETPIPIEWRLVSSSTRHRLEVLRVTQGV